MCVACVHYAPWGAVKTECGQHFGRMTRLTDNAARVTCPECIRASAARNGA